MSTATAPAPRQTNPCHEAFLGGIRGVGHGVCEFTICFQCDGDLARPAGNPEPTADA